MIQVKRAGEQQQDEEGVGPDLVIFKKVVEVQWPVSVHHIRRHVTCEIKEVSKVNHAPTVNEDNALDLLKRKRRNVEKKWRC